MHDLKLIRETPAILDASLEKRGLEPLSDRILALDHKHRAILTKLQELQSSRNQISKEVGIAKQKGLDVSPLLENVESIKKEIPLLEEEANELSTQLHDILSSIPNLLSDETPVGSNEDDNVCIKTHGTPPTFDFTPLSHDELGEKLGLMDFARGAKISGSRFVVLYSDLAKLERAIARFMLDTHTSVFGYKEVYTPYLVNDASMYGTGQLPKMREDSFQTTTGLWLIPTAEISLTNLVAQEILSADQLPMRLTAYTPCFRSEAGAAGKDTRGMIRNHQFSKVELVSITRPEESKEELERMRNAAETILQKLGLSYRVMVLCSGDIGFCSQKTYDLEVWMPSQNKYREISSCSICGDFQARRMNTRYRQEDGKPAFVHTLNGSGLAVGRTMVAILENYQQADGSIVIPDVLIPYMDGMRVITSSN